MLVMIGHGACKVLTAFVLNIPIFIVVVRCFASRDALRHRRINIEDLISRTGVHYHIYVVLAASSAFNIDGSLANNHNL
jgi:hypothetical protein